MEFEEDFVKRFGKPTPIPDLLHSAYAEEPFRRCTVCNADLHDGRLYEIQKVFRGKEAIFEMAVCQKCGESVAEEFSEESITRIRRFLTERFRPSSEPEHCHFCGLPRGLFSSFTVVGACQSSALILPTIVMCEPCSEKLQEQLSKKTRDVQADFVRDTFPGVPADLDLSPSFILG